MAMRTMRGLADRRAAVGAAAAVVALAATAYAAAIVLAPTATADAAPGPWARTEDREPCASFELYRQPFFGDTHVHTAFSSDAVFAGTQEDPRGAYRFAKGEALGLPPYDAAGRPTRSARLRRPLDFTAVTDHAEQFGEVQICLTPGLPGYDSPDCVAAREQLAAPLPPVPTLLPPQAVIEFLLPYGAPNATRFSWCGPAGELCLEQASLVWQDVQAAAEQHYDRTSACAFTTFVAYEWSGQPGGNNLHRNVIFRNATVPALPTSYIEEPTPQGLWQSLERDCLADLAGCDVLAIPHNPNASGGLMFAPVGADGGPLRAAEASVRAAMEPVVEMTQHKGDSECRPGVGTTDELCGYEKLDRLQLFNPVSDPGQTFPPLNYVRNALKEGLAQEQALGVNPFRFGLVGSTDDHNATPGNVEERDWGASGHIGNRDRHPASILARVVPAGIEGNPGGLAVVWAEENSRDALFAALRRREVYATSGTRPILRFFAGRGAGLRCGDADLVAKAYRAGVPMGGEIGPVEGDASPRFAVLAFRDPGDGSAPLQRVQIVKGWVDAEGRTHEKVFDVAGDADGGADVDTRTCAPRGPGFDSLCAVWRDPEFSRGQRAFYYARLLENPTCRWSTYVCNGLGLDCDRPASVPPEYAECCNPAVPKTIQERAWSSPIWYRPEGIAEIDGEIELGDAPPRGPRRLPLVRVAASPPSLASAAAMLAGAGTARPQSTARSASSDLLRLRLRLGRVPAGFDPATDELALSLRDDDEIYRVTIPAGTLRPAGPGRFSFADPAGRIGGLRSASLARRASGDAVLELATVPRSLSAADRSDHFVELTVRFDAIEITTTALWRFDGRRLAVEL